MAPAAARAADGEVYLYLQPFPPGAAGITFTITSLSAMSVDGAGHPVALHVKVASATEVRRQRLLASGDLPAGSYAGFTIGLSYADLETAAGSSALAVPQTPVRVDVPFTIVRQRASVVWITLKYEQPASGAAKRGPAFSATLPQGPVADHAGFVSNSGTHTITVFDKRIEQVAAVIETCDGPSGLALDQLRRRLYVACPGEDEIQAIDVVTGEIIQRTPTSPGDRPREIALTADGSTLVSANSGSNSVGFFDAASLTRTDRVNVGDGPTSVAIEPAGRRVFAFNTLSGSVSVIDMANRTVVATLSTDGAPLRGRFNARGDRLYVIFDRSPYLTVFDTQQLAVVTRARLGAPVSAIAVDIVRGLVAVGSTGDTMVDFYDPNAMLPLYAMRTPAGVSYMAIDVYDSKLYLVSPDTRSLLVGRLADRKVVSEIDVGDRPYWVAIMGEK